ncbi:MAG: hypothetical protein KDE27_05675 [Planctomycetes bacterium]|nr:hypothetical protein [Planctomycetota bacterium]
MIRQLCALAALAAAATPPGPITRPPSDEPPLRLTIELDGRTYDGEAGRELEVTAGGKKLTLRVGLKDTRVFAEAGIRFEFERGMLWDFHSEDGVDSWSLEGKSCIALVQRLAEGEAEDLAPIVLREILASSTDDAPEPEKTTVTLGDRQVPAWRASVESEDLVESWLTIGVQAAGRPVVISLQDFPDEADGVTDEIRRFRALLEKTFRLQ